MNRMERPEEHINELEERATEITQSEQQKENRMEKAPQKGAGPQ